MMTPGCHPCRVVGRKCDRCRRLEAWGTIVSIIFEYQMTGYIASDDFTREALGAVAFLMQELAALVEKHRKELNDEIRAAQREGRRRV